MAEKTVPVHTGGEQPAPSQEATRAQEQFYRPPVDIYETAEGLVLIADLPGVSKENLDVEVNDGVLSITARTQASLPGAAVYNEYELVSFHREFELSDAVDPSTIRAELRHGVLTLRMNKRETALPRKVEVSFT
ncbi:MAG TPA: Hsp20/alpha crystallin family protein [Chthonomonadales bacterium]|nr:Hsp20/alpha crystallin family protein [Chthonomonadales bacterium]